MKQILLLSLALMVSTLLNAQELPVSNTPRTFTVTPSQQAAPTINKIPNARAVADTLFPAALSLECAADGPVLFSTQGGAFVFGTNEFFDFEKIQRLSLEEEVNVTVSEVLVGFAFADQEISGKQVSVNIYNDLAADGSLGDIVGSSDTLLVSQTAVYDTSTFFTSFTFSTPVELTGVSSFMVGVDISSIYFDETGTLDTLGNIGIGSTPDACGDGTNVLEIFPTANGLAFNNVFVNWQGLNAEMYVGAIIDRDPFTSTRTPNVDLGTVVYPNPVQNELAVTFNAPLAGEYQLKVVSAVGAIVSRQSLTALGGSNRANFDVAGLSPGMYLLQVEGATGMQSKRFVKK